MMKIMVIILIVFCIILTSCTPSQPVEQKTVLKCGNLIFDCTDKDCGNQCGTVMSKNNEKLITGLSVNSGKGCECTFLKYG